MKRPTVWRLSIKTYHLKIVIILLLVSVPPFLISGFYSINMYLKQSIQFIHSKNENDLTQTGVSMGKTLESILGELYSAMLDKQYSKTSLHSDRLAILNDLSRFFNKNQYSHYLYQAAFYNEDMDYLLVGNYGVLEDVNHSPYEWLREDTEGMSNYQIKATQTRSWMENGEEKSVVSLIAKLPLYEHQSYLIFNIDIRKIDNDFLLGLNKNENAYHYFIADSAGSIVVDKNDRQSNLPDLQLRSSVKQSDQVETNSYPLGTIGWNLVCEVDVNKLYSGVYDTRNKMVGLFVLVTLLILAIIFLLARQLYEPVKNIIAQIAAMINRKDRTQGEFDFISSVIDEVIRTNSQLHSRLSKSEQSLKKTLIRNLIENRFVNRSDIQLHLQEYRTPLVVVIFTMNAKMNLNVEEREMCEKVNNSMGQWLDIDLFFASEKEFVVLFRLKDQDINTFTTQLVSSLDPLIMEHYIASIGGIHQLEEINNSYIEALYAFNMGMIYSPELQVYCYNKLPMDIQFHQSKNPTFDELEIAIRRHDEATCSDLINLMFSENRSVTEYHSNFYTCVSLLIRLYEHESVKLLNEINAFMTARGMMNSTFIKQFFIKKFTSFTEEQREDYSEFIKNSYVDHIKKYIADNYASNFSMDDAAEHVGVTRQYISQLFKKRYNSTMIDYLNQYRIEQAKKMLVETQIKVADIGERVGFNSKSYFTKVFRLTMGITPTEYRELSWSRNKGSSE
ncbi:AraC family transcriptional regulator [Paenibacillus sp. J5C_2022]|uniref:helix-turn-helix transcriptional regulator n=1 Tax=Paenibacillus sp. J5C2022 TaxID=2977129 RepID=UPI0021CF5959|nr:helix-turn-helix domain-containing protein [Paenibacillus sp. J5C2022]MCU6712014.1 AraC family transcriptional regulator [Paenibacillus sp. J5C2022]